MGPFGLFVKPRLLVSLKSFEYTLDDHVWQTVVYCGRLVGWLGHRPGTCVGRLLGLEELHSHLKWYDAANPA